MKKYFVDININIEDGSKLALTICSPTFYSKEEAINWYESHEFEQRESDKEIMWGSQLIIENEDGSFDLEEL